MTRTRAIPAQLRNGPFTLQEAARAGLSYSSLKGKAWLRLGKGLYRWEHANGDPWLLFAAWRRALGADIVFSGFSAAWMHGLKCVPTEPVEVSVPTRSTLRSCNGLVVRHCDFVQSDLVDRREFRLTALLRTLRDLSVAKAAVEALVVIDAALDHGVVDAVELHRYASNVGGLPGAVKLRTLAARAAPAESPMETRLRWLLVTSGLPVPKVQVDVHGSDGQFIGRADMYYPEARLVIEFDGGNHRDRLVSDNRRQNELVNAGFTVLRFTSSDFYSRPEHVVARVRGALGSAPQSARIMQKAPKEAA